MAESFLFNIAERVLDKITLAIGEVRLALNVENDLRELQDTMTRIKAVLLDAERQQHQNEALRLSIWKLRDLFYDAEDVVDQMECEALRKEPSTSIKVRRLPSCSVPLAFSLKVVHRIKEINKRLDKIATEWNSFNLGQRVDNRRVIHRETHSFVNSSDVIGRDQEKQNIISLLMEQSDQSGNIPVISIVGIGGLGKTALAQSVYNDKRVTEIFPLRIWVYVSDEFDLRRLLKEIIQSIKKECEDSTIDILVTQLGNLLKDKQFLLVLDDVWNEDRVKWIALKDLLMSISDPSQRKIIVTTRSFTVASVMSSCHSHELKGLQYKDCLALFTKWAFNDGDEQRYPNLMRIGEKIVEKCKGVPLAVRTLGSLLFSKTDESEWISVRDNEIWRLEQSENDILPVLKLSYHHLPPHLQRCLAYLSLYKKDYSYYSDDVVQFWLANGLLESPKQNQEWEDVGGRYLNELWSRCFIQDVDHEAPSYFTFKIHDLIHDLALEVSQKECKTLDSQTKSIDEKVRHVSLHEDLPLIRVPLVLKKLKQTRTVVNTSTFKEETTVNTSNKPKPLNDEYLIKFCVTNFKFLRALDFSNSSLKALPNCIGNLKHLRYVDLTCCGIRKLPNSFHKLRSLLTLRMRSTFLKQLPADSIMQSLIRLRYLEITFEAVQPKPIRSGCWSSLQYLGLVFCRHLECLFEGMQYLTSLRSLYVAYCPVLVSLPRSLKFLTRLEHLYIRRCRVINLQMEPEEEEDQDLRLSLKTFSVRVLPELLDLPRLLLEGSAGTLQSIKIERCEKFEVLPEWLQNLASLEKLEILECPKLSSLPGGMDRLTALRQLKIEGCPALSERCRRDGGADWHKISHVQEVEV